MRASAAKHLAWNPNQIMVLHYCTDLLESAIANRRKKQRSWVAARGDRLPGICIYAAVVSIRHGVASPDMTLT